MTIRTRSRPTSDCGTSDKLSTDPEAGVSILNSAAAQLETQSLTSSTGSSTDQGLASPSDSGDDEQPVNTVSESKDIPPENSSRYCGVTLESPNGETYDCIVYLNDDPQSGPSGYGACGASTSSCDNPKLPETFGIDYMPVHIELGSPVTDILCGNKGPQVEVDGEGVTAHCQQRPHLLEPPGPGHLDSLQVERWWTKRDHRSWSSGTSTSPEEAHKNIEVAAEINHQYVEARCSKVQPKHGAKSSERRRQAEDSSQCPATPRESESVTSPQHPKSSVAVISCSQSTFDSGISSPVRFGEGSPSHKPDTMQLRTTFSHSQRQRQLVAMGRRSGSLECRPESPQTYEEALAMGYAPATLAPSASLPNVQVDGAAMDWSLITVDLKTPSRDKESPDALPEIHYNPLAEVSRCNSPTYKLLQEVLDSVTNQHLSNVNREYIREVPHYYISEPEDPPSCFDRLLEPCKRHPMLWRSILLLLSVSVFVSGIAWYYYYPNSSGVVSQDTVRGLGLLMTVISTLLCAGYYYNKWLNRKQPDPPDVADICAEQHRRYKERSSSVASKSLLVSLDGRRTSRTSVSTRSTARCKYTWNRTLPWYRISHYWWHRKLPSW